MEGAEAAYITSTGHLPGATAAKKQVRKAYRRAESTKMQLRKRCTYMRQAKQKHQPKAAFEYRKHQLDDHNYNLVSSCL